MVKAKLQLDGFDDKGRPVISSMSDREIMAETLTYLRDLGDAIERLAEHPMIKAALPADMRNGGAPADLAALIRQAHGK